MNSPVFEGGCACGRARFRMTVKPMYVHCCHCARCQTETGSACAVNAVVETSGVTLTSGETETTPVPADSGKDQMIVRCAVCKTALWSHYGGFGEGVALVRTGALDPGHGLAPDIHIYTRSKQPWAPLPEGVPQVSGFYPLKEYWPAESRARLRAAMQG
ncbi:MAG: GFA family protein [Rhodospirillales bacterium]